MAWSTKNKKLGVAKVVGHSSGVPGVVGRAPGISSMTFGPLELFGAMARCSHLNVINPLIVTHESQLMAKLLEQHVDDVSASFAILGTANNLKDYARSHFAGTVAAGIAYLAMIRDGYVWCDHFENMGGGKAGAKKSPDFVFAGTSCGVALMEAKGTRSSASKAFDGTVRGGYKNQVEPHLGSLVGGAFVSHGYCIGSHMRSLTRAKLHIHHTDFPAPPDAASDDQDLLGAADRSVELVQRNNYATVLRLVHGEAIGRRLRSGEGDVSLDFTRFLWRGRTWLGPPWLRSGSAVKWRYPPWQAPDHFFALEETIARKVLSKFLFALDQSDLEDQEPLGPLEFKWSAFEERPDGAVYPDGMAIVSYGAQMDVSGSTLSEPVRGKGAHTVVTAPQIQATDNSVAVAIEQEIAPTTIPASLPRILSSD